MRRLLVLAAFGLAACNQVPAPRVDSEGMAAQKVMDAATTVYAECISGHAAAIPVGDEAAGSLALGILKTCKAARDDLLVKVAKFRLIGHPKDGQPMADAVAEASVQAIDDELRGNAVVTIVKRQTAAATVKTDTKI
ncbi:hypothetical protein GCM10011529_26140 [Polymorphobacter glacialis]|uniref:Lipoprotein n=2 Tax=Sandarakinorhabdus glacialis TaxID=1614636 RepID=A0A916ZXW2_9SPHN|nr:hypothetical protein GCM10011529_26140 [Polymorphobacter glacialis]